MEAQTKYHSKLFATELMRRCASDSLEKMTGTLADATIDLNPHQIDAALFPFHSPLTKGVILADEVGLGKTIEAGLVISQRWAERKRKILIITPANLRKQWYQELADKFFLDSSILESKTYNQILKKRNINPFSSDKIIICSYHFAKSKAEDIRSIPWDLVVIDEAHRLRNVYKPSNVIGNVLKSTLRSSQKLLLTATPLQNSLLELYGLISILDDQAFGDVKSFRDRYAKVRDKGVFEHLRLRIKPFCHRTLRRQVEPYIKYTKRHPMLQEFTPSETEMRLYDLVSEYLRRENLQALPNSQRTLIILVLRKQLASSSYAIAGALDTMRKRLLAKLNRHEEAQDIIAQELSEDFESYTEESDEWEEDSQDEVLTDSDIIALKKEIDDLKEYRDLAESIKINEKGQALLQVLQRAFEYAEEFGVPQKVIIFTESKRTQNYLVDLLSDSPFSEGIVLFNGSNNDERLKTIYQDWKEKNKGTDRVTGSRTADKRSAIVDYFRDEGKIMIATEAGAEGINLQFCSLVVNYDLPWNPQRVEQRIGRCHRYGQKHDVVVVNFLNTKNAADKRVFELLSEKFKLFEGVFGSSDEVLGSIESGVDFEKRIVDIYQKCRTEEEIEQAFAKLREEMSQEIDDEMTQTSQKLLENFDDEVREKLRVRDKRSNECLTKFEQLLIRFTKIELGDHAQFNSESSFTLLSNPDGKQFDLGLYELPRRSGHAMLYRPSHPMAQYLLKRAKRRELQPASISFHLSEYEGKITSLEPYIGQSGVVRAVLFTIESMNMTEEYIVLDCCTDVGEIIDPEIARRMFDVPATMEQDLTEILFDESCHERLTGRYEAIQKEVEKRNTQFYDTEAMKLDEWAEDMKSELEREIKDIDREIRDVRRATTLSPTLEEKLEGQRKLRALETQRSQKRRSLFDAQDDIDRKRDNFIKEIENKLVQQTSKEVLFSVKWQIH